MENQIKLKKAPAYRFIPYLLVVLAYCQIYVGTSLVQQAGVQLKEWFSIGDTGLSYLQTVCTVGMGIFELIGRFACPQNRSKESLHERYACICSCRPAFLPEAVQLWPDVCYASVPGIWVRTDVVLCNVTGYRMVPKKRTFPRFRIYGMYVWYGEPDIHQYLYPDVPAWI